LKKSIFIAALAAALAAGAFLFLRGGGPTDDDKRELVVQVLRVLPREFLVAATSESLAASRRNSSSWYRGVRKGTGTITVRTHCGFDLSRVEPKHVRVDGSKATVQLPPLEIFDASVDLATWHFVGKQSGLSLLADAARGRSLEAQVLTSLKRIAQERAVQEIAGQRPAMLARLNERSRDLFRGTGLDVRFE
jgi:hypothetical protein